MTCSNCKYWRVVTTKGLDPQLSCCYTRGDYLPKSPKDSCSRYEVRSKQEQMQFLGSIGYLKVTWP
jgi:hypothetical protein